MKNPERKNPKSAYQLRVKVVPFPPKPSCPIFLVGLGKKLPGGTVCDQIVSTEEKKFCRRPGLSTKPEKGAHAKKGETDKTIFRPAPFTGGPQEHRTYLRILEGNEWGKGDGPISQLKKHVFSSEKEMHMLRPQ